MVACGLRCADAGLLVVARAGIRLELDHVEEGHEAPGHVIALVVPLGEEAGHGTALGLKKKELEKKRKAQAPEWGAVGASYKHGFLGFKEGKGGKFVCFFLLF